MRQTYNPCYNWDELKIGEKGRGRVGKGDNYYRNTPDLNNHKQFLLTYFFWKALGIPITRLDLEACNIRHT